MGKCNRCKIDTLFNGTCVDCSTSKLNNYEHLEKVIQQLKDQLHRKDILIKKWEKRYFSTKEGQLHIEKALKLSYK